MHLLTKLQALELVREQRHLFDNAERSNPFAGSAWTLHFIEQVADDTWTFVVPEHAGGGQSLMLLYAQREKPYRISAVANYYSSLYSPIISSVDSPADRALAAAELVDQLLELRPRSAVLSLSPLDQDSADTASLHRSLARRGWYTKQYDCFGNWYLPCANTSFDEYMKGRDSQLRNTWTRKRKKFDPSAADGARLEIVGDPDQVSRAMDAYERVYAKSWKKPEPYATFVRGWAEICASNGWLRLGVAWLGDVPIAAQFWFTMHNRAYIFKLAYDEEYARLSAGTVLSAHMVRHALEQDRVVEIDYLTGDDAYKQSWMTSRRQRIGVIACNPRTVRGLVIGAQEFAGAMAQRWRGRSPRAARASARTAAGTTR
jgi:CelD/BcsL family acetyltransferase involved in cellulose biosynthesis